MINNVLHKIAWKTRRWNLRINLLNIYLHDGDECWGFSICEVVNQYRSYSLLSFEFRLPNRTTVRRFTVDSFDILFIATPLRKWAIDLDDAIMWGRVPTTFQRVLLKIVEKVF